MEAALLAALTAQTQQLILIGDHKQLRPKTQEYSLSVDSGRKYKLDVSMFERIAQQEEPPAPVVTLSTQRRMHPCISSLIKVPSLYPDLLDSERVAQYPQVRGMRDRLFFWDHDHREAGEEEATGVAGVLTGSKQNAGEAAMVVALARYLLQQGYKPDELAVITPYVGQLKAIRALMSKARPLSSHARHLPHCLLKRRLLSRASPACALAAEIAFGLFFLSPAPRGARIHSSRSQPSLMTATRSSSRRRRRRRSRKAKTARPTAAAAATARRLPRGARWRKLPLNASGSQLSTTFRRAWWRFASRHPPLPVVPCAAMLNSCPVITTTSLFSIYAPALSEPQRWVSF